MPHTASDSTEDWVKEQNWAWTLYTKTVCPMDTNTVLYKKFFRSSLTSWSSSLEDREPATLPGEMKRCEQVCRKAPLNVLGME